MELPKFTMKMPRYGVDGTQLSFDECEQAGFDRAQHGHPSGVAVELGAAGCLLRERKWLNANIW